MVAEQLATVPGNERVDYQFLKNYKSEFKTPEIDIAWSDAFSGAAAWLADRERHRVEKEKRKEINNPMDSISQFNI